MTAQKYFLFTQLVFILVQLANGGDNDSESEEDVRQGANDGIYFFDGCGAAVNLEMHSPYKFSSPNFGNSEPYPDNLTCKYHLIGSVDCRPVLQCVMIDLRKPESECSGDHVKISDGIFGERKVCDQTQIGPEHLLEASPGYRDLFFTFTSGLTEELGPSSGHKGFKCVSRCYAEKEALPLTPLPPKEKPRKTTPCVCGIQPKTGQVRIVGGEDAELNEFPWLAALVVPRTRQPFCGAALINDRFVLTAAHCFFFVNGQPSNVEVVLRAQLMDFKLNNLAMAIGALKAKSLAWGTPGSIRGRGFNFSRKSDIDEKSLRYKVVKITNHPLFNNKFDFDVSLLQLENPIDFRMPDAPVPICLPPVNATDEMYHDDRALVSGWGKGLENAGSNNRLLQKLDIPILNLKECNETMPYDLTSRMICAGFFEGGKDACTGDSGGPLIYKKPQGFIEQIGIVSWGEGCARIARPGLYSRVSEFIQWIEYETSLARAKWCSGSYY